MIDHDPRDRLTLRRHIPRKVAGMPRQEGVGRAGGMVNHGQINLWSRAMTVKSGAACENAAADTKLTRISGRASLYIMSAH